MLTWLVSDLDLKVMDRGRDGTDENFGPIPIIIKYINKTPKGYTNSEAFTTLTQNFNICGRRR